MLGATVWLELSKSKFTALQYSPDFWLNLRAFDRQSILIILYTVHLMPDASETCDTKGNHCAACALNSSFFLPILLTFVSDSATSINVSTMFAISGSNLPSSTSSLTLSCRSLCACLLPQFAQIAQWKNRSTLGFFHPETSYTKSCGC